MFQHPAPAAVMPKAAVTWVTMPSLVAQSIRIVGILFAGLRSTWHSSIFGGSVKQSLSKHGVSMHKVAAEKSLRMRPEGTDYGFTQTAVALSEFFALDE